MKPGWRNKMAIPSKFHFRVRIFSPFSSDFRDRTIMGVTAFECFKARAIYMGFKWQFLAEIEA